VKVLFESPVVLAVCCGQFIGEADIADAAIE